jgi:XTP/dITP diphosphohydrolase
VLYLCSSNRGKLRELERVAEGSGLEVELLPNLGSIAPPDEHGSTFEENASSKAIYYSGFTEEPVMADDSGLEVDALYGAPGVHSARYSGPDATDEDNINLLLANLGSATVRTARFVCVVALARNGALITTTRGHVDGEILRMPRGANGFGYDPVFYYPPLQRSFAELTADEKRAVSHRGRAMHGILKQISEHIR